MNFILPFIPDAAEPILYGLILLSAAAYYWLANTTIKKVIAVVLGFLGLIFIFDPMLVAYNVSLVNKLLSFRG